jgi:NAD(P)-dependent dehydrogenase (short-subunit alcohol dehydrogenase family)
VATLDEPLAPLPAACGATEPRISAIPPRMKIDLRGKRAVVTGSSSGIGLGIVRALAEAGATVFMNGRDETRLALAVERLQRETSSDVAAISADLGTAEGAARILAAAPEADILVNNVATIGPRPFLETSDEEWERAFQTTVMSAVRLSRHYVPGMVKRRWGRLLFNGSVTGGFRPGEMVYYGAMKAALLGLSRTLAEELAGTAVTVNSFLPGPTLGEANRPKIEEAAKAAGKSFDDVAREWFAGPLPSLVQRFLTPEEVGHFVVFLASEQASGVTGAGLRVDGGIVRSRL